MPIIDTDLKPTRRGRRTLAHAAMASGALLLGVTSATHYRDHWFDPVFLGAVAGWGLLAWGTYELFVRRVSPSDDD